MQVHIKVYGMVQGVFFRSQAKAVADDLGLTGWIRNDDDGSVETVAEGPREKLKEFEVWCENGPPFAKVKEVKVDWSKQQEDFASFEILGD